jgi:hypothetical protein
MLDCEVQCDNGEIIDDRVILIGSTDANKKAL